MILKRWIVPAFVLLAVSGCGGGQQAAQVVTVTATPAATTSTAASEAESTPPVDQVAVPNVVGKRLSDAQAVLTAAGLTDDAQDASPANRVVLNPENWIVQSQKPSAGSSVTGGTAVTVMVLKPSDGQGGSTTKEGVIPNVVCKDLQTAQDTLQAAGFFNLGSTDATGEGRMQLVDRNWVVVSQSARAGSSPDPSARVVLGAVKFGEPTGKSGCKS